MSGGFRSYDLVSRNLKKPSLPTPERLPQIQQAVKKIDADFIGLIDTHGWKRIFSLEELKKKFGYPYVFHTPLEDNRPEVPESGITVLSRFPVFNFETVRLHSRNAVKSIIDIEGRQVDIFTVYLDDLSEETRVSQVKALCNLMDKRKTIVMGDFNSILPEKVLELKIKWKLVLMMKPDFKKNPSFNTYFKPVFESLCNAQAINLLRKNGFLDARGQTKTNTFPTPLLPLNLPPLLQVDYIFHTPDLKVDINVPTEKLFNKASDHFPIVGIIKSPPNIP